MFKFIKEVSTSSVMYLHNKYKQIEVCITGAYIVTGDNFLTGNVILWNIKQLSLELKCKKVEVS